MQVKKVVLICNGQKSNDIICDTVNVKIEGDTITVEMALGQDIKTTITEPSQYVDEDIPQDDGIVAISHENEKFVLTGEDAEVFESLSDLRRKENRLEERGNLETVAKVLESAIYDIQDLNCIQSAIFDLIDAESKLLAKGYKAFKYTLPEYEYEEDKSHFKLVESIILLKPNEDISQEKEKSQQIAESNNSKNVEK